MANEEKSDKPGQLESADPGAHDPGGRSADRPLGAGGENDPAEPPVATDSSAGFATPTTDSAPEASYGISDNPAPLRTEPRSSGPSAGSREDLAQRPAAVKSGGAGRGFAGGIVGSLLVLGAAGAGAYLTQDRWVPPVANMIASRAPQGAGNQADERVRVTESINTLKSETADVRSQFSSVGTRLQSLQQEIDSLKQQSEKLAASAAAAADRPAADIAQPLEDIDQRLSRVEVGSGRLSALEQRLADVQSALSNVQSTVEKTSDQASRPTAAVLAINQLAEAVGRSGGYAQELESVRAIAAGDSTMAPAIGTLDQWSRSGVPSMGEIRAGFPPMAQAVAQTQFQSEGEGWFDEVRNRLSALVTVRKVGDAALKGGGIDATLARADAALESGDLAGAVKAIEGLEGAAAEPAADWLAKARERLAADKALVDLRGAAISKLNAARG